MKNILAAIVSTLGVVLSNNVIQPGNHYNPATQTCAGTPFINGESGFCLHEELSSTCSTHLQCPSDCCSDIQGTLPTNYCLPQAYCSKKVGGSACTHDNECYSLTCSESICSPVGPKEESIFHRKLQSKTDTCASCVYSG